MSKTPEPDTLIGVKNAFRQVFELLFLRSSVSHLVSQGLKKPEAPLACSGVHAWEGVVRSCFMTADIKERKILCQALNRYCNASYFLNRNTCPTPVALPQKVSHRSQRSVSLRLHFGEQGAYGVFHSLHATFPFRFLTVLISFSPAVWDKPKPDNPSSNSPCPP